MKAMVLSVAIMTLIAVAPTQAQSVYTNLNVIGTIFGSVHHLGLVSKGDRVTPAIAAITTSLTTCPIKVTILVVQQNAGSKVHKVTKKQNKVTSSSVMSKAKFDGEGIVITQAQNSSHLCVTGSQITFTDPSSGQDPDTQDLSTQDMPNEDGIVENWAGDEVPDQAIPVQRDEIPQQLLDFLDNMPY